VVFDVGSLAGKTVTAGDWLECIFSLPVNVAMTIDLAGVMLTEGTEAPSNFQLAGLDSTSELRLCKRYYEVMSWDTKEQVDAVPNAKALAYLRFETQKRVVPTVNVSITRTAGAYLASQVHFLDLNLVVFRSQSSSAGSLYEYGATLTADAEIV
jgi:hypothetical protein